MAILLYTSVLKWFTANPFEGIYTLRNYALHLGERLDASAASGIR